MKKFFVGILSLFVLIFINSGCVTTNQKELELAYYETQKEIIKNQQQQEAMPLFEMISKNNDKPMVLDNVASIKVYQPTRNDNKQLSLPQYRQTDYMAPWIGLINKGLSIGIPAYAAYKTIDSVASHAGNMYTNSGEGNFNVGDVRYTNSGAGNLNMTEQYTDSFNEGSFNDSIRDSYENGMWDSTITDNTHDPIVVEQPPYNDPIVVEQPPYNDPIVIEQPPYNDPIVIEQPPYNDPIVIEQPINSIE